MLKYFNLFLLFCCFLKNCSSSVELKDGIFGGRLVTTKTYMFWPNGTVPFYINPDHFDHEQATAIMTCLSMIAFKTCIKFAPVMTAPEEHHHVMTFINPDGIRRCRIENGGHSNYEPHIISLGYDCLKAPEINMIVLRALGLPFEHNRKSRDVYIDVMIQNVDPSYVELFTKDSVLPPALRILPYDMDSVMHFGERDYSKNGHRTIIFKNRNFRQNRNGLTPTDIKKIEMIYGPECRTRDRAEKVALCQSYPGIARRKREITEPPANKSLRVNPNITPPAHIFTTTITAKVLNPKEALTETQEETQKEKEIEVVKEITKRKRDITKPPANESLSVTSKITPPPHNLAGVTEEDTLNEAGQQCNQHLPETLKNMLYQVYQLTNLALKNARVNYCNVSLNSTAKLKVNFTIEDHKCFPDVLGILKNLQHFSKAIKDDVANNLTEFCQNSENIEAYQRRCKFDDNAARCLKNFRLDKENEDKADDKITQTTMKSNRRKREVPKSEVTTKVQKETQEENTKAKRTEKEKKIEVATEMNLKEKVKAIRKDRLKEIKRSNNTRTSVKVKPTTSTNAYKLLKENKKVIARKFSEKRYQIQNRDESNQDSDITLEKNAQIEPEISLKKIKKELVQDVSSEIKSKVVDIEEKTAESVEQNKGKEDGEEDVIEEVSEEEIHKKADKTSEEVDTEEDEEKPQNRQRMKQHKRKIPKTVELTQLNKEFYTERRWPDGDVIYVIADLPDYDLQDLRSRLSQVDSILRKKTCVKLREVDAKEAPGFDDYMILDNSPDYVTGKVGGKQNFGCIELFEGGQHKQHTAMMVMAMLGFYFEVSRHDRDKHIRVHNRHIRPDKLHHFEKLSKEATLNIPYDYKSATHPSYQFWRKIGKTGLATVATYKDQDPNGSVMQSLGQNPQLLSEYDILKINSVYGVDCFKPKSARLKKDSARMQKEEELLIIQ